MKCEIRDEINTDYPFDCDCCNLFIRHQEKYKRIVIGWRSLVCHDECYDEFKNSLKSFVDTM